MRYLCRILLIMPRLPSVASAVAVHAVILPHEQMVDYEKDGQAAHRRKKFALKVRPLQAWQAWLLLVVCHV